MLLSLIRQIVALVLKATPTPNFTDVEAVQDWLQRITPELAVVIVTVARQLTSDHLAAATLLAATQQDIEQAVQAYADESDAKIDVATIIAIVMAVIELLKLWREWRNRAGG